MQALSFKEKPYPERVEKNGAPTFASSKELFMATAVQYVLEMAMSGDGNGKAWISLLHLAEYVFECPIPCSIFSSHETLLITISSCCD
ncbi:hypothetical protein D5086_013794 [Populus alba]|uniref:Uncharacterized protein n=1 Tax=Populus alba TaxID=43335 RepID=A0ACC4C6S8_POPAL